MSINKSTFLLYNNMFKTGMSVDRIREQEHTAQRTVYKYLNLAYLSPKIINSLMSGKLNMPLRDVYELASKSQDFSKQEQLFLTY